MKLPVRVRVFDAETDLDVTNDVDAYTENLSREGMCLSLPWSWDCPECNNCLGWIYNMSCKLKNDQNKYDDRGIAPRHDLKISFFGPAMPGQEQFQLRARCVWVNPGLQPQDRNYYVGVRLPEADQQKLSAYLPPVGNP